MYPFRHYKKKHLPGTDGNLQEEECKIFKLPGADGKFHEVEPEIFKAYKKLEDHENYLVKRDRSPVRKAGNDPMSDSFPRVVSMDSITEAHGDAILPQSSSAEEYALGKMSVSEVYNSLYKALESLTPDEKLIIRKIFFEGMSGRDFEDLTGISRTTMQYRKSLILKKLKSFMVADIKGFSPDMIRDAIDHEH